MKGEEVGPSKYLLKNHSKIHIENLKNVHTLIFLNWKYIHTNTMTNGGYVLGTEKRQNEEGQRAIKLYWFSLCDELMDIICTL